MPEITYTPTLTEHIDESRVYEIAGYDTVLAGPIVRAKIAACREWVAANPEYPDGTIAEAVIETVGGETRRVVERFDGKWFYAPKKEVEVILQITSLRVLHTPPTMRDHLHAIGLSDEQIALRDIGNSEAVLAVLWKACREATYD